MRTRPPYANWAAIIMSLGLGVAVAAAQDSQPATAAAVDPEVDKILTRLERREVRDLHARLAWRQRYVIDEEEDAVTKTGEIWYQQAKPVAKFLIHFAEKVASGRKDVLDERHLFDGQWYIQLQSRTKTWEKREVRKPDAPDDPYKVGQGVFPLPFGQKKEDVLREFDVRLVPPAADDPPATDHLRLTPRENTETAQTYRTLEFWVSREGPLAGLPLKVQAAKLKGTGQLDSYITITFSDAELNAGFSAGIFKLECPPGYEQIIEELKPAADPPAGAPR